MWNYFIGEPVFVNTRYPNDSDTTSLAMLLLNEDSSDDKEAAMRTILTHTSPDGLPYVRILILSNPRCANILTRHPDMAGRISTAPLSRYWRQCVPLLLPQRSTTGPVEHARSSLPPAAYQGISSGQPVLREPRLVPLHPDRFMRQAPG